MKLYSEERLYRDQIYTIDVIINRLRNYDTKIYSIEFFVSEEFLVIKIYKK